MHRVQFCVTNCNSKFKCKNNYCACGICDLGASVSLRIMDQVSSKSDSHKSNIPRQNCIYVTDRICFTGILLQTHETEQMFYKCLDTIYKLVSLRKVRTLENWKQLKTHQTSSNSTGDQAARNTQLLIISNHLAVSIVSELHT